MTEDNLSVELIFKPFALGPKLRPEEIQLLLAYAGEILKAIEAEENSAAEKKDPSCT